MAFTALALLLGFAGSLVPALAICGAIARHARRAGVKPAWDLKLAYCGWVGGMVVVPVGMMMLADLIVPSWDPTTGVGTAVVLAAIIAGGSLGASFGYLNLKMRTVRDPDYGEHPDGSPPA